MTNAIDRIVDRILDLGSCPDVTAQEYERRVAERIVARGYEVEHQHRVPDRGDGRSGRIDLYLPSFDLGIEIDRKAPRAKSHYKLAFCSDGLLVVRFPRVAVWRSCSYSREWRNKQTALRWQA